MLPAERGERAALIPFAARRGMHDHASNERIRAQMGAEGFGEPAFITQAPNMRGAKNFYQHWSSARATVGTHARTGQATVKGTFDAHPDTLLESVARSHDWNLKGLHVFELSAAQQNRPGEQNTLFLPSEVELNEVTQVLLNEIERIKPTRVVLDSLSELRLLAQSSLRFRRQILALKQHFVGKKCTVILVDDKTSVGEDAQAHTVAHGVIELEQFAPDYGAERRRLRVVKLRGVKFRGGWHDYGIVHGGLTVFPRLIAAEHRPGVLNYFALAAGMAELVGAHPLQLTDDPAEAFVPIAPRGGHA